MDEYLTFEDGWGSWHFDGHTRVVNGIVEKRYSRTINEAQWRRDETREHDEL